MTELLDRYSMDSRLFQFTTKRLRDFIDPNHLSIQIEEKFDFAKLVKPLKPSARGKSRISLLDILPNSKLGSITQGTYSHKSYFSFPKHLSLSTTTTPKVSHHVPRDYSKGDVPGRKYLYAPSASTHM